MVRIKSSVDKGLIRKPQVSNNTDYWKTEYLQPSPNDPPEPQSFLIEQIPNSIVHAHFHRVNQYQVVVKGKGKLGKHEVLPVSVHYSDGYTPYGPIQASDDGLFYFTLRAHHDLGAYYMPESRAERKKVKKSRVYVADDVLSYGKSQMIIEQHEDGLGADYIKMSPNQVMEGPDPNYGGGQFYLVVNGSMIYQDQELPLWSCAFVFPDEKPLTLTSGDQGLDVLVLQYPFEEVV